ncbi:MAG: winged helix-turn-helix transcriptional regulator [Caulobacteraceae bacterium]
MAVTNPRQEQLTPSQCQRVGEVLARVGDKWTVLVINELGDGSRRFNELRREIPGVSQRMLTLTLKNLERDGLVSRAVTPSVPPRVDYALTDLGRSMLLPVRALGEWAAAHIPQMDAARSRYDTTDR